MVYIYTFMAKEKQKLTYIQISVMQKQFLDSNKVHKREPYREVLERLLKKEVV